MSSPPCPVSSNTDTLLQDGSMNAQPSWLLKGRGIRNASAPISKTFDPASLPDLSTPAILYSMGQLRCSSERSRKSRSDRKTSSLQISSPITSHSSVDATLRGSIVDRLQDHTTMSQPSAQPNNTRSWPSRHQRLSSLEEVERMVTQTTDPKSEFSDSEDGEEEQDGSSEKTFRRQLSETFSPCFVARKAQ